MGDFARAIGQGISGFVEGSLSVAGDTVRGVVTSLNTALPGGILALVVFVVLLLAAWKLTTR